MTTALQMTPVTSSQIAAVGYDPATQDLAVQFTSGGTYTYHGVHADTHAAMMAAESVGRFLNQEIKPVYTSTRPDGSICPPTAPKASGNGKPAVPAVATEGPTRPAFVAKTTNVPPAAGEEPYTWDQFVADMEAGGSEMALYMPQAIVGMGDLQLFGRLLAAVDGTLAFEEQEYQRRIRNAIRRREALLRYYGPLAERFARELIPALGGRKSIDTPTHRFSLTTQPARLELSDPEAALTWAKANLPDAVVAVPERVIPASEALVRETVVEAWKAAGGTPDAVPTGFNLVPETQRFSCKSLAGTPAPVEA